MLITLGISIKPVLLSGKNENMWAGIAKFGFFFSKKKRPPRPFNAPNENIFK